MIFKKHKKESIKNKDSDCNYIKKFNENDMSYIVRNISWEDTYYTIDKDENVLLQCRYRVKTTADKEKIEIRDFHFYVVEKNKKRYCKLINLHKLDPKPFSLEMDCDDYFKEQVDYFTGRVGYWDTHDIAIFLPNYRKRLLDNTEIIKLDKEFDELLEKAKDCNFENAYHEMFDCKFQYSSCNYDCYDFYNKHVFVADGFCLKEFEPYVKLLNYIFSKSNYSYLNPSCIKIVESLDEAYEKVIKEKEQQDEFDYADDYADIIKK